MRILVTAFVIFLFVHQGYAAESDGIFGKPFNDGSPACVSCHSVVAAGYKVSTWGPDISGMGEIFGDDSEGWLDFIKSSGILPMDAVYANSAISAEEIEGLVQAYAKLVPTEEEPSGREVIIYAAVALAAFIIAARLIFRRNRLLENDL